LGRHGIKDFKAHPLFAETKWDQLRSPEINPPPFIPELNHDADTSYFEDVNCFYVPLPSSDPNDMIVDPEGPDLSFAIQPQKFIGFTFKRIKGEMCEGNNFDISTNVRFEVDPDKVNSNQNKKSNQK
jgi:hypothetical protein